MWNPKQSSSINKSLDHLSSKFNELEKICQTTVQKGLAESKNILSQQTTLSSEIYSSLIKEQTRLENNQRALISIRKSYNDELNNLRLTLFGESIESTSTPDKSFAELKTLIEETVLDTRDKVLEMPELNYFDNSIKERVQNYFEETFQRLDSTFLQFNNVKELNAAPINFKKIEMIANTNLLTLTGIDNVISQAKRRIIRALEAGSTCSSSFAKEVHTSEGLLNQIREKIFDIKQGASLQKSCDVVEKLVNQAINSNSKKTELFESANKELENICSKFNQTVKELTKHSEIIKNNHQTLESTINKEKKKARQSTEPDEQISKGEELKRYNSATYWNPRQASSPNLTRSPLFSEVPDFMDTLCQKILHLRTTTGNFISSCEKMGALIINTSSEGNYAVKVFENEKKLVENYIISLAEFVMQQKNRSQESALTKASSPQAFRSTGGFDLSPDHNKDSLFRSVDSVKSASKLEKLKALESSSHINKVTFSSKGFEDEYAERGRTSHGLRDKTKTAGLSAEPYESHDSHRYDSRAISSKVSPLRSPGHKLEKDTEDTARRTEKEKNRALLSNLLQKVKDLSEQNEKLKKEVPRIAKENKKLELKADKRKKTVKQLFELVTEKEKELTYYKTNYTTLLTKTKNVSGVDVEQIEQIVDKKGEVMMEKYRQLEAKMGAKETEIQKLKEIVSAGATPGSKGYRGKMSPRFGEEEEDEGRKLVAQTKELDKKRESIEEALQNINDTSPSQVKELNSLLTSLKKEKEQNLIRIRDLKAATGEEKSNIERLEAENKALEARCHELLNDIEQVQAHKQKIEKSYQEEVKLLNDKVRELNEYIQSLEVKKNEKLREALSPDKWRANLDFKDAVSPQKSDEGQPNENKKLKNQIKGLVSKVESLLDHFGITKEEYSMMDSDEKIEIISARVKKEEKAIARKEDGEKLTTELNELKQLVNSRDSQIKKLESEIANQKTVILKFGDLEKNNQLLQEEIASQQEKVAKANSQKQKAEEQVEGLRSQLKAKEEEITAALSQNKGNETELKESSGQYEDQLRALKQQLTNKENTIRDLERKSEQNDNSIVDLEKKFNEKEKELSRLKQELVSEKERLQKEVDAASSRTLEQANAQATQDIEAYKVEVNGLNNKLAGLEAQIASVNKEKQEVQNSLEAAVKEKEALQGQIKDLKEKNNSLEQVKKALEIQVSTLEVKVAAGANDQQDVAEKLSKLQEAIDSLRNEKIKAEEELGKATTQFELEKKTLQEKLEKIIGEKEAELKDRKEDLQKVEKANSELNNVNNELNRRVGELTKSNEELKVEKEAALNETINLNEQSSQAKEAIKNQISEYEKAIQKEKDQLKQAQDELTQLKIQKESVQKGLEVAEGKINELEKKLEEKEKDLQKISEENNNVKKELEKRETEAAVQQQEFSRKRAELEQTLAKGSGDVVAKQEEIEKLKEQISIVEGQVEEEKKKVQELISTNEKKLLEAHREFYEKNKQITNQNEALVRDNQLLKAEGGKLSKEYQILLDKEAELQSELNAFVEKHEEMQAGLTKSLEAEKQLTKTLQDETRAESQRLHRKVEKLQRELEKSRENNETLKGNYEKLVEEHKQKQEHIHALGQEIDQLSGSLKAKVSELEVSKNSGSKEAQSIRNEYDYQLQHLNIENESLKRTKEELEEEIKSLREDLRIERGHIEKMNGEKDALEEKGDQLADETAGLKEKLAEVEGELEKVKTQSNSKIEKLVQEEKALKEENKRLEGENEELKMTTLSMREEIVNLGSKGEDDKKTGKIAMVYREELMNLVKNKPFSEIGMVKLENEEEIRQTIKAIKDAVENQEKKKEELNKLVKTMRSDASDKIKRVSEDIKDVIEILPTEYVPDDEEGIEEQVQSSIWMNAIKEYIIETNGMRREYKDLQQEVQETQTEARNLQEKLEHDEKLRRDLEKHKEALESENKQLKVEVSQSPTKNIGSDNFLRPQSPHKEAFSFRRKSDARDPSFSVPDEIDEGKVRSFLEDSIKEKSDHKRDERLFSQEQEQIKTLFEQIRQLQDENDKLETENRQVKAKYEMLGFENEDLKGELADKEGEIKKLEEQLFVIKEEFSKIQMEKDRKGDNPIAHEKQHIRTMFTKFILSALQGNKDAEDLLKLLLSLLDINEKDKTNMMNEFKSKNTKKGVFAKLF